jgi:uncharacterized protein (DUF2336 family)
MNRVEQSVSETSGLSVFDVERLLNDPSIANRAVTASKIGRKYAGNDLGTSERRIAEDIFHLMVKDVEVSVRKALSESIVFADDMPRSIARALASDVSVIALPFLEASNVLDDDDLIEIVRSKPVTYASAIAGRKRVSSRVCDALVDTKDQEVVVRLVQNTGAQISEPTFTRVLDNFGHVPEVMQPIAVREQLPLKIAERLVTLVSEKMRHHLVDLHGLAPDAANAFIEDSRERTTVNLLDATADIPDIIELTNQLHLAGRLTPSIALRALCSGDVNFFEAAVARRANLPMANVTRLLADGGKNPMQRLFERAAMPMNALGLTRIALDLAQTQLAAPGTDVDNFRTSLLKKLTVVYGQIVGTDLDQFVAEMTKGVPARRHS